MKTKTTRYSKKIKSGAVSKPLSQEIYDSTADFGVFLAFLGLIGASLIGCIMIGISLYLIFNKGTHSKQTEAEVLNSKCDVYRDSKKKTHKSCNTKYKYTVDSNEYENIVSTTKLHVKNTKIKVLYDPKNPADSVIKTGTRKMVAYILLGVALLIIIFAVVRYYIVKTYKVAAAATGVGEAASIAASPFQSSTTTTGPSDSFGEYSGDLELVDSVES